MIDLRVRHRFATGFELAVDVKTEARSIALHGPSGSGKTTMLRVIAGLLVPREGRVRIGERTLLDTGGGIRVPMHERHVGYVMQDSLLFPLLSVRKNLLFGANGAGRLTVDRVTELLEIAHLLDRQPRHLSGGERQRVALGRALLAEPDVLLCDEPFASLDEERRDRLIGVLDRVRTELDVPLILVSHRRDEVDALVDQIVHLESGVQSSP